MNLRSKSNQNRKKPLEKHRFEVIQGFRQVDLLCEAAMHNRSDTLEERLAQLNEAEINLINSNDRYFENYLFIPAKRGYYKVIQLLNEYGINIHKQIHFVVLPPIATLCTALHAAVYDADDNVKAIEYLINQGQDVNCEDGFLKTPFHLLLDTNFIEKKKTILLMLKSGAELDDFHYDRYKKRIVRDLVAMDIKFINIGTEKEPKFRMRDENGLAYETSNEKKLKVRDAIVLDDISNEDAMEIDDSPKTSRLGQFSTDQKLQASNHISYLRRNR